MVYSKYLARWGLVGPALAWVSAWNCRLLDQLGKEGLWLLNVHFA